MKIILQHLAKRFNYEWIFRDLNHEFKDGNAYAITGPNGSGKSTLLKIISGQLTPSEGTINYSDNNSEINVNDIFQHVSYSAPYIDLIDDFTLKEYLEFHFSFKKIINNHTIDQLLEISGLNKHKNKSLKSFSSGMKQRAKLTSAILSETHILLLDEPTTNLDKEGVEWYLNLIQQNLKNRVVIVGSNMEREYGFCKEVVDISGYKIK